MPTVPTIEEYTKKCQEFFFQPEFDFRALAIAIRDLKPEEFKAWQSDVTTRCYQETRQPFMVIANGYSTANKKAGLVDTLYTEEQRNILNTYKRVMNDVFVGKMDGFPLIATKQAELLAHEKEMRRLESLKVTVDGKDFVALERTDVLWSGWECDSGAWIVEDQGELKLVGSDHGEKIFVDASFLEERVKAYRDVIESSEKMLGMLRLAPLLQSNI